MPRAPKPCKQFSPAPKFKLFRRPFSSMSAADQIAQILYSFLCLIKCLKTQKWVVGGKHIRFREERKSSVSVNARVKAL